uniref:Uncharacterized protein n=1 Tax=Arundo donax TaxID=35708 RepID=A0A0A9ERR7_ARUDO
MCEHQNAQSTWKVACARITALESISAMYSIENVTGISVSETLIYCLFKW